MPLNTVPSGKDIPASFAAHAGVGRSSLPRVCIVTGEIVGPFKNGGLGTSMTGLAELLAAHGAAVTVIYTGDVSPADFPQWLQKYKDAGITLELFSDLALSRVLGPMAAAQWTKAWGLFELLKTRRYDVIHFNDTVGEGVFCFVAKRLALRFQETLLCLALHSPTEWILENNGHPANWPGFSFFTTAERISIEATDLLWGPSLYLIQWVASRGYRLPPCTVRQQYVIPTAQLFSAGTEKLERAALPPAPIAPRKPKEIVFFGRLEERKGIRLFTAAITRIGNELVRRGARVLFMGKPSSVGGVPAEKFLESRCEAWPFEWRVESTFGQPEAVKYLRETDCVAVIASPVDNSPCTVYEALQFGIPFLAARSGGIPELILEEDHQRHLFDYSVNSLASRLLGVLDDGIGLARPAVGIAENQTRWLGFHASWRNYLPAKLPDASETPVALIIDHTCGADSLEATVRSAHAALGNRLRAMVVIRRELAPINNNALRSDLLVIDEFADLGPDDAVRHARERGARGVVFLRSGVALGDSAGSALDRGFASDADALVPAAAIGDPAGVMPAIGASAALAFLEGDYDTGGLFVKLGVIEKLLADDRTVLDRDRLYFGLTEELLANDYRVWPLPDTLIKVAHGKDVLTPVLGAVQRTRAYARAPHRERYQMLSMGRETYRAIFEPNAPSAPSTLAQIVIPAERFIEKHIPGAGRRNLRQMGKGIIQALFGDRGVAQATALVRRLRGG